jgi:hypothetical protein
VLFRDRIRLSLPVQMALTKGAKEPENAGKFRENA